MNIKVMRCIHCRSETDRLLNKKVAKMDTFYDGIISARCAESGKPETVNNKISEVKISLPAAGNLFARSRPICLKKPPICSGVIVVD